MAPLSMSRLGAANAANQAESAPAAIHGTLGSSEADGCRGRMGETMRRGRCFDPAFSRVRRCLAMKCRGSHRQEP